MSKISNCPCCDSSVRLDPLGRVEIHDLMVGDIRLDCPGSGEFAASTGGRTVYGCGTEQARRRHRYHGEECAACGVTAGKPNVMTACGTERGWRQHQVDGTPVDDACGRAHAARGRRRLRERKAVA